MSGTKRNASNPAAATRSKQKKENDPEKEDDLIDTDDETKEDTEVKDSDEMKSLVNLTPMKKAASPNKLGRRIQTNSPLRDAQNSVSVIYVNPDNITGDDSSGLVFIPRGFMMDKWMAEPFYLPRTDKWKIQYLEALNCVPWVMDGAKNKSGGLIKNTINTRDYPVKCICFLTDGAPSEDDVVELCNKTIAPWIWNNYLRDEHAVRKNRGEERNLP